MTKVEGNFEWSDLKDIANQAKHGVSFCEAQAAFLDANRIITHDIGHSDEETRYYCLGSVYGRVLTVRFTYRAERIRITGAGY